MFKKPMYGSLPAIGLPVQVQCDGFKCMAFRDREGRWVDLFHCINSSRASWVWLPVDAPDVFSPARF